MLTVRAVVELGLQCRHPAPGAGCDRAEHAVDDDLLALRSVGDGDALVGRVRLTKVTLVRLGAVRPLGEGLSQPALLGHGSPHPSRVVGQLHGQRLADGHGLVAAAYDDLRQRVLPLRGGVGLDGRPAEEGRAEHPAVAVDADDP